MNWKYFLPLPLAALLVGHSFTPPKIAPELPEVRDPRCNYASAVESYLTAYAYAREAPARARGLLEEAEAARARCAADTTVLAGRIAALKAGIL
ncbi:MAG: hypothetical protein ACXVB9_13280 [Bdellovibrionota bacterium]